MEAQPQSAMRRTFWWAVVGTAATLSYASLTWLLAKGVGLPAGPASIVGYALSACVSYVGHRQFTFRSSRRHREALSPFLVVSMLGYALALLIPATVTDLLGAPIEASIVVTCVTVPALTYVGLSRFVFWRPC